MFKRLGQKDNNKNAGRRQHRTNTSQRAVNEPAPVPPLVLEDLTEGETLRMYRVVKDGFLTAVPDAKVGHFYAGDSYVLIYAGLNAKSEQCITALIWHGTFSSLKTEDDAVHRAIQSSVRNGTTSIHTSVKIIQGNEPSYFRTEFWKHTDGLYPIIHGGGANCGEYDCMNYVVNKDMKYHPNISVFWIQIKDEEESTVLATDVAKKCTSLNSQDCFLLLSEGITYLWMGKKSTRAEREISYRVAGKIAGDEDTIIKMVEGENDEIEFFWDVLGGKGPYAAFRPEEEEIADGNLFVVDGWNWKAIGTEYTKSNLNPSTVAVLDAGPKATFMWVGSQQRESCGMFYRAVECLDSVDVDDAETRPIMIVTEGFEHEAFTTAFRGWEVGLGTSNKDKTQEKNIISVDTCLKAEQDPLKEKETKSTIKELIDSKAEEQAKTTVEKKLQLEKSEDSAAEGDLEVEVDEEKLKAESSTVVEGENNLKEKITEAGVCALAEKDDSYKDEEEVRESVEEKNRVGVEEDASSKVAMTVEEVIKGANDNGTKIEEIKEAKTSTEGNKTPLISKEDDRINVEKEAAVKLKVEIKVGEEGAKVKEEEEVCLAAEKKTGAKAEEETQLNVAEEEEDKSESDKEAMEVAKGKKEEAFDGTRIEANKEEKVNTKADEEKAEKDARLIRHEIEESKLKTEEDLPLDGGKEATLKVDDESVIKIDVRLKTDEDTRLAEKNLMIEAVEEARSITEVDAQLEAEMETNNKSKEEVKVDAKEQARLNIGEDTQFKGRKEKKRAEEENRLKTEKGEEDPEKKANATNEEEARLESEKESTAQAKEECRLEAKKAIKVASVEEARLMDKEDALVGAEKEGVVKTIKEVKPSREEEGRLRTEDENRMKVAEAAPEEEGLKTEGEDRLKTEKTT